MKNLVAHFWFRYTLSVPASEPLSANRH
jgi:hypothetical protein